MPKKVKTYQPPWARPAKRATAAQRGYTSAAWLRTRRQVIARDGGICQACGRPVTMEAGDAHIDHIIPKRDGGTDALDNLQLLHRSCHSKKTAGGA